MRTLKPTFQKLVVAIVSGVLTQLEPCFGAAWEGTDDFSGTLAKWDTTYIHIDNPSDGLFLSGGHLQFIKTATTTDHSGSGAVIWPQSLPFNTNWTLMVDAHMNPGTYEVPQIPDQDVRLDVHLFSTNPAPGMPSFRIGVNTSPYAGTYGNFITIEGSDPTNIIGTDITLGMSYDSATKQVTSFYFPAGDPSSLVTIQTNNVAAWLDMRPVLYGASDYWAVSASKVWLDNFRVFGTNSSTPVVPLTNGLVAYYPFNGNANDASGYQNNPLLNTASLTPDRMSTPESAYVFSGTQHIQYASQPQLETTTNLTVSCWVRTTNTDSAFHGLVCKATASNPWVGFQLAFYQSRVRFELDLTGYGGTKLINDGQWHFVCAVIDQQQQKLQLFVDDKLDATYSTPGTNIVTQFPLFVGTGRGGVGFFDGSIDEVRLYNRALSASEVQQLYQAKLANGQPFFTNTVMLADGRVRTEIRLPSNGIYTLMHSEDLKTWDYSSMLPDNTNRVILTSSGPVSQNGNGFYRVGVGSIAFPSLFFTFGPSSGSIIGTAGTRSYPATNNHSGVVFELRHVDNPLPATNVFFNGPPLTGVNHIVAGAQGGGPSSDYVYSEWYSLGGVHCDPSAMSGPWTINYGSEVYTFNQPDPAIATQFVVITPSVTLSNGFVTSVSWDYRNPTNGAILTLTPTCVSTIHLYLNSNSLGTLFRADIPAAPTNCVLDTPVQWNQIDTIDAHYSDTVGNYYYLGYSK